MIEHQFVKRKGGTEHLCSAAVESNAKREKRLVWQWLYQVEWNLTRFMFAGAFLHTVYSPVEIFTTQHTPYHHPSAYKDNNITKSTLSSWQRLVAKTRASRTSSLLYKTKEKNHQLDLKEVPRLIICYGIEFHWVLATHHGQLHSVVQVSMVPPSAGDWSVTRLIDREKKRKTKIEW